jgi:hypothetical protein
MEHNPSWEADSRSRRQKIPRLLWNQKFHCRIHKRLTLVIVLSQLKPLHTYTSYLYKIHFNIIILSTLRRSEWSLLLMFIEYIFHVFIISSMCATCPAYLILLVLITILTGLFGEEYKLWRYSLCNFLHPPVTSYLLGLNILLSTLFLCTLNVGCVPRQQVSSLCKTTRTILFLDRRREYKRFFFQLASTVLIGPWPSLMDFSIHNIRDYEMKSS